MRSLIQFTGTGYHGHQQEGPPIWAPYLLPPNSPTAQGSVLGPELFTIKIPSDMLASGLMTNLALTLTLIELIGYLKRGQKRFLSLPQPTRFAISL